MSHIWGLIRLDLTVPAGVSVRWTAAPVETSLYQLSQRARCTRNQPVMNKQTLLTPILAQTDTRKALRWVYLPLQRYHSICLSLHSHNNHSSPGPSGRIALSDMWSFCSSVESEQMISTDGNEDILLFVIRDRISHHANQLHLDQIKNIITEIITGFHNSLVLPLCVTINNKSKCFWQSWISGIF